MSLVPDFELGLWNAWIFVVLGSLLISVIGNLINKEAMKKFTGSVPMSKTEKILALSTHVIIMPFTMVYSFFLPLKLGTVWFYVGIPICFLYLVMYLMAVVSFATTPLDKLVTKGVYRISRHPLYFAGFLEYVDIGIACAS